MIKSASQSSLLNDKKYSSMLAGQVPSSEYKLDEVILTSSASSVTFDVSAYAGVYTNLQVRISMKADPADRLYMRINGTTSYYNHFLYGNGSSVGAEGFSADAIRVINSLNTTTNHFDATVIDIQDAFLTSKNKVVRYFASSNGIPIFGSGLYNSTSAITELKFGVGNTGFGSNNILAGSRFSLYGSN